MGLLNARQTSHKTRTVEIIYTGRMMYQQLADDGCLACNTPSFVAIQRQCHLLQVYFISARRKFRVDGISFLYSGYENVSFYTHKILLT